jgi:hypothetical protein
LDTFLNDFELKVGLQDRRQGSPCENQNDYQLKGDSSREVPVVTTSSTLKRKSQKFLQEINLRKIIKFQQIQIITISEIILIFK